MLNSYIVRLKNNKLLCFYYYKERGILYKVYENNKWGKEIPLLNRARENFTVSIDGTGVIYVFCQDEIGDIVLSTNKSGDWVKKVVLKNNASKVHHIQLNPMFTGKGLCLVYNLPAAEEKSNYIVYQIMEENGAWSPASRIDKFTSFSDCMFQMQQVSQGHYLLYYMTRTTEYNIGYREITPKKQGLYNAFHSTNYIITDSSFLTTTESIHVVYIVKSMFSYQLIYRKKESDSFSNPLVIAEGQKLENCLLFFTNENLYITYISNSQLFYSISDDSGRTFTRPARYKNKFCLDPTRANYISEVPQSVGIFFCRQVYVDKNNPWDIQLMPDLCENFYPIPLPSLRSRRNNQPEKAYEETSATLTEPAEIAELQENISKLKNQIYIYETSIAEKNKQIMELSVQLQSRSEEFSLIEIERKNKIRYLEDTVKELSNQKIATVENKTKQDGIWEMPPKKNDYLEVLKEESLFKEEIEEELLVQEDSGNSK